MCDDMTRSSDSLVIIPTYNEAENAAAIIDAVVSLPHDFDVLIVDDGSPDGTAGIVRKKMEEYPGRVKLLERKGKLGLGTAYIAGFKYALGNGYDYIFEMDADFSHNPNDLMALYKACHDDGADVAIGSRYISGVNVVNWPMSRVLMSYFASNMYGLSPAWISVTPLPDLCVTAAGCLRRLTLTRSISRAMPSRSR